MSKARGPGLKGGRWPGWWYVYEDGTAMKKVLGGKKRGGGGEHTFTGTGDRDDSKFVVNFGDGTEEEEDDWIEHLWGKSWFKDFDEGIVREEFARYRRTSGG